MPCMICDVQLQVVNFHKLQDQNIETVSKVMSVVVLCVLSSVVLVNYNFN